MKICSKLSIVFIWLSLLVGCTNASAQTDVQKDFGDDVRQGLKYVNDQANIFLNTYNEKHKTNWISLEPDLRIMVYKCLTDMQVTWISNVPDIIGANHDVWYLQVSCSKTTAKNVQDKQWTINIPTTRPKQSLK